MTKCGLLFASVAVSVVCSAFAAKAQEPRVSMVDDGPDVFAEDYPAVDITKVELFSDGEFVVIATTLAEGVKPTSIMDALIAGVAMDTDNDPATGGQGFDGYYADVPGIEFESEVIASVEEDGGVAKTASASVVNVLEKERVLTSSEAVATPAKGTVYTAKIAYADIGAKSGQVIRLVVRELSDRGDGAGIFPDAVLKLK